MTDAPVQHFAVPDMHCAGCIRKIEQELGAMPAIARARVNFSTKRVSVTGSAAPEEVLARLTALGFSAKQLTEGLLPVEDRSGRLLLACLAVAGFATANIMLLSVSVWSGADGVTRDLLHWISALIALPAIAFSGRPFFRSAAKALAAGRVNMDVPISLGVVLAAGLSLYETLTSARHAYFDAAVMLLFFLLIGRYLDHLMRARARDTVTGLVALQTPVATVLDRAGQTRSLAATAVEPGMRLLVAAGDRLAVDGEILTGATEVDRSLVTGESLPEPAGPGTRLPAGTLNLAAPVTVRALARANDGFLAEIIALMETADQGRSRYVRVADRAARLYAPAVHLLALASFIGWMLAGAGLHLALVVAITVLIITCPCALGLAVPAVQVVAAGRLFSAGVLVKDGAALERLAEIDHVVFDKTGTLTLGEPVLAEALPPDDLILAASLAQMSRHPLARAVQSAADGLPLKPAQDVEERPGQGLAGLVDGRRVRLGKAEWVGAVPQAGVSVWLRLDQAPPQPLRVTDRLRPDAAAAVAALTRLGLSVSILSGDRPEAVAHVAQALGVEAAEGGLLPQDKLARIEALSRAGAKVLMVGDGINDAPSLAAGHASMAPSTASDIGTTAADLVFLRPSLAAVPQTVRIARRARGLVQQNFALALGYNLLAVPIAIAGFVTPLIAALAMSSSSILVTLNALRLKRQAA